MRRMVLNVPLHGDQVAAELQAHRALVGSCPIVSAEVLDHGRVVPRTLTAETTLKGFLSWKGREQSVQKTGKHSKEMDANRPVHSVGECWSFAV